MIKILRLITIFNNRCYDCHYGAFIFGDATGGIYCVKKARLVKVNFVCENVLLGKSKG